MVERTNLVWADNGPLCPQCGRTMRKLGHAFKPTHDWVCLRCLREDAVLHNAIGQAVDATGPAEYVALILGVELTPVQAALINSRFGTRARSEAQELFRKEMGLD